MCSSSFFVQFLVPFRIPLHFQCFFIVKSKSILFHITINRFITSKLEFHIKGKEALKGTATIALRVGNIAGLIVIAGLTVIAKVVIVDYVDLLNIHKTDTGHL